MTIHHHNIQSPRPDGSHRNPKRQRGSITAGASLAHASGYERGTKTYCRARRRGILLVATLVCIAVAIMLAAVLGKAVLLHHRHVDTAAREQQSLWLAESAVQRAIHRLHASPDYAGETWEVPADVLGSDAAGIVIIQVTKTSEPQTHWQVHVESRYPAETTHRVTCRRTLLVPQLINP